jgi:hypothetical protein
MCREPLPPSQLHGNPGDGSELPLEIYCEYPMLLMHVELKVERLGVEVERATEGLGFLDAL